MLAECLDALVGQRYRHFEVIVVDDASTDHTRQLLMRYPEVRVITLTGKKGHGFVAAVNRGIAASLGEIVALLNNDAVPDPEWLGELVRALERNPWASMAASKLVLYDRPGVFHSTGDYYGLDGVANSRGVWQEDSGQYEREEEVFGPCGAAVAYLRTALADIVSCGGTQPPQRVLDPQLWMYLDDVDLNLRARLRGHRTVYVPTARVRHRLSATGGGPLASYYVGRNTIYVIAKDLPLPVIVRNLPRILKAQAGFALEALRHVREPAARARLRGMVAGVLTWPRVLPTRRRVLRSATLSALEFQRVLQRFSA
jgi:GT2 family glycosyltransferase